MVSLQPKRIELHWQKAYRLLFPGERSRKQPCYNFAISGAYLNLLQTVLTTPGNLQSTPLEIAVCSSVLPPTPAKSRSALVKGTMKP